jgi:hypothetical protein
MSFRSGLGGAFANELMGNWWLLSRHCVLPLCFHDGVLCQINNSPSRNKLLRGAATHTLLSKYLPETVSNKTTAYIDRRVANPKAEHVSDVIKRGAHRRLSSIRGTGPVLSTPERVFPSFRAGARRCQLLGRREVTEPNRFFNLDFFH